MSHADSSERDLKVLQYIRKNPDCSKENVARGMNGDPSRITVRNILTKLEQEKMIVARKDKPNSQIYKLSINEESSIVSVIQDLDDFKKVFFTLIDKTNQKFKDIENETKIDNEDILEDEIKYIKEKYRIIDALVVLYRHLFGVYILYALFKWSKEITDKQTLDKLYSIFFSRIEQIQFKLFEVISNQLMVSDRIIYNLFELKPGKLDEVFEYLHRFGLGKQAEQVLDSLWQISSDFAPRVIYMDNFKNKIQRPLYGIPESFSKNSPILRETDRAKDWRKIVKIWKSIRNNDDHGTR
jgi:hypothetical protein